MFHEIFANVLTCFGRPLVYIATFIRDTARGIVQAASALYQAIKWLRR